MHTFYSCFHSCFLQSLYQCFVLGMCKITSGRTVLTGILRKMSSGKSSCISHKDLVASAACLWAFSISFFDHINFFLAFAANIFGNFSTAAAAASVASFQHWLLNENILVWFFLFVVVHDQISRFHGCLALQMLPPRVAVRLLSKV